MMNDECEKTLPGYDHFYAGDKFHFGYESPIFYWREWVWRRWHMIRRFGIKRGSRVLELACGQGFHVNLLSRMGMDVVGVDLSKRGIEFARHRYPKLNFLHGDATSDLPFKPESFDIVWSNGAGFFHYDVTDEKAFQTVRSHLRYLKPGGLYIIIISTDLSGRKPADWSTTWMNTLDDFRSLLSRFNMPYTVDWEPDRWLLPFVGVPLKTGLAICSLRKTA